MEDRIEAERMNRLARAAEMVAADVDLGLANARYTSDGWITTPSPFVKPENTSDETTRCPGPAARTVQRGILTLCVQGVFRTNSIRMMVPHLHTLLATELAGLRWRVIHLPTGEGWSMSAEGELFDTPDLTGWTLHPLTGLGLALAVAPPEPLLGTWIQGAGLLAPVVLLLGLGVGRAAREWRRLRPRRIDRPWARPECGCEYHNGGLILKTPTPCPSCAAEVAGGIRRATPKNPLAPWDIRPRMEFAGPRIRRWREMRGWSVEDLARRAKIDAAEVERFEAGLCASVSLARLARATGQRVEDLMRPPGVDLRQN